MERSSRKFGGGHQDRWESWWQQFQQVALVNGWTPQESVQFLPLSLNGEALLFYQALPQAVRQGQLAALAQALQARFAPAQRGDLYRAEFLARRQRDKESLGDLCRAEFLAHRQRDKDSLGEYCEAVRELGRLACP